MSIFDIFTNCNSIKFRRCKIPLLSPLLHASRTGLRLAAAVAAALLPLPRCCMPVVVWRYPAVILVVAIAVAGAWPRFHVRDRCASPSLLLASCCVIVVSAVAAASSSRKGEAARVVAGCRWCYLRGSS